MQTVGSRMSAVYSIVRKAHGVYVLPLFAGFVFLNIRIAVALGMAIDTVLFPSLKTTKADRPIVLVGNPRTGTTFLQRFLSDQGFGHGMQLFMSLYPSLTLQTVLRPFLPLLEMVSPAKWHSTEAHHTSLSSVETDDVSVLFRYFDGLFLYGFFLSWHEDDLVDQVEPQLMAASQRDFDWLEKLWTRSLVLYGADRNIAKLFSLVPRLSLFMERFPNAQILYTVRDPLAVVPSSMSLLIGVLDRAFGFWSKPEEQRQMWLDRMYQAWLMLFRRFHEDWTSGKLDQSKIFVVRYDRMMKDFDGMMDEMCAFLGQEMTPELRQTIAEKADKQRAYKSKHKYDLAKFGLDEERIRKDFHFVYETFLPEVDWEAERAKREAASA